MKAHITGSGQKERRSKDRNKGPEIYLAVEIILVAIVVFLISFADMKLLTVLSGLAAVYFVIMSCIPRYRKIIARQVKHKSYNHKEHYDPTKS